MLPQKFCAQFSHASRILQQNLPHTRNSSLEVSAVATVTTPQNCQKFLFLRICASQIFCVHFLHASNNSYLNLPQTCSSSFEVSAFAVITTSQNRQKLLFLRICAPQIFCA